MVEIILYIHTVGIMYRVAGLPVFVVAVYHFNFTLCRAIISYNYNMAVEERKSWYRESTSMITGSSCQNIFQG